MAMTARTECGTRLPEKVRLFIAGGQPPRSSGAQRFNKFSFMHALVRKTHLSATDWQEALNNGGLAVRDVVKDDNQLAYCFSPSGSIDG